MPDAEDQRLPAVLKRLRKDRGLTQEALAFPAGLTTRSYQDIEHGKASPKWDTLLPILKVLDIELVEFAQAMTDAEP